MKLLFIRIFSSVLASLVLISTVQAGGHSRGLVGSTFVVSNLFKGDATKGQEVDVTKFGLVNNTFAKVGKGVELPRFITLYDIDVSTDSVSFDWVESPFSKKVSGVMPADKHDRNYFIFDLEAGREIKAVSFDAEKSNLHPGSALPTVTLIGPNKFMTEFASGVIRKAGFKPSFKVTVE